MFLKESDCAVTLSVESVPSIEQWVWQAVVPYQTNGGSCYLLPVSRNHQVRRGTTADIGDNLLTVFGCSLTAVEIETGPLSDIVLP